MLSEDNTIIFTLISYSSFDSFYDCSLTFGLQPFPILKGMTIRDSKKEEKMTGRKQSSTTGRNSGR